MKKIIFIAGMSGGKRDMSLTKKILKEFEVLYFPYNTKLTETFEEYANQLKNFIDETPSRSKLRGILLQKFVKI